MQIMKRICPIPPEGGRSPVGLSEAACRAAVTVKPWILAIMLAGLFVAPTTRSAPTKPVPTNSLAFHLQSLGRATTKQEQEVIAAALVLMHAYGLRTDFPLRAVKHDIKDNEWVLDFDSGYVDAAFSVFLTDKSATSFEAKFPIVRNRSSYGKRKS